MPSVRTAAATTAAGWTQPLLRSGLCAQTPVVLRSSRRAYAPPGTQWLNALSIRAISKGIDTGSLARAGIDPENPASGHVRVRCGVLRLGFTQALCLRRVVA